MRKNSKRLSVANFNTVFLKRDETEAPLLEYFDTIVMPALHSDIQRQMGDVSYRIMNVKVCESENEDLVLTGYIVKKTVLERYSDLDSEGNLIELDERYSAAPFSIFAIYLKNHRMIFVENQKGSPRISSFRSTIKYIIDTYVRMKNEELKQSGEELLPIPLVNVVGIPSRQSIEKELKNVAKINKLTLKFFPLNGDGDINYAGAFSVLAYDARKRAGCNTGDVTFNSPQNIPGVVELLESTNGLVEPIIKVTDKNNAKKTIRQDKFTESMDVNITGASLAEAIENSLIEGSKLDTIKYVSDENAQIYEKNSGKIVPFIKQ